ncbi:hypothetical protein LSHI6S_00089 [Leifsonia shinshuensis]
MPFISILLSQASHVSVRLWCWSKRHPRIATLLAVFISLYVLGCFLAGPASAEPLGKASPDAPGDNLTDSSGVRASHYINLFINRGDLLHTDKMWVSGIINGLWTAVFNFVVFCLSIFQWLLEFKWVEVVAAPVRAIAMIVQTFVGQLALVPTALFLVGVVAGFYVMRNKWPAALVEVGMTIGLSILATGIFANPIAWVTGDNGPLQQSISFGGQISAALSGNGYLTDQDASTSNLVSDSITTPIVDLFIAQPAQALSFGHVIGGDCAKVFHDAVTNVSPITADDSVRNAVNGCDQDAGQFADNPSWSAVSNVASVGVATFSLLLFAIAAAALIFAAVAMLMFNGFRLLTSTIVGMFPFTDRRKFWGALFGVFAMFVAIMTLIAALALYLTFLKDILNGVAQLGIPLNQQMQFISLAMTVVLCLLVWHLLAVRRGGKRLGERMAGLMETTKHQKPQPLLNVPNALALSTLMRRMPKMPAAPAAPAPQASLPTPGPAPATTRYVFLGGNRPDAAPSGPAGGGYFPATPRPQTAGAGGAGGRVAQAAMSGTRLARAAIAGPQSLALEAGRQVAEKAISRSRIVVNKDGVGAVQKDATKASASRAIQQVTTDAGIRPERPGRRIVVGADGVGHVQAPKTPRVFVVEPIKGKQLV